MTTTTSPVAMPAATAASVASHTMSSVVDHRWPRTAVTPHVSDRGLHGAIGGADRHDGHGGPEAGHGRAVSPDGVQHDGGRANVAGGPPGALAGGVGDLGRWAGAPSAAAGPA